jgi:excisionase family DNA binding protein
MDFRAAVFFGIFSLEDRQVIERHYSAAELAKLLGVSRPTIYNRVQDGTLSGVMFGERLLVPESSVQAMLERNRVGVLPTRRGRRPSFC